MSASADIQTRTAYNVLSVPIQSVTTRIQEQQGSGSDTTAQRPASAALLNPRVQEYVFVFQEDGTVKLTPITSGVQDSNHIEILTGLSEGDKVVTGPFRAVSRDLKDGDQVTSVTRDELFGDQ